MTQASYIMESEDEALRLDLKTNPDALKRQVLWAGLEKGMRVADLGCGPGKTSFYLNRIVQPGGSVLAVDISPQRIAYAKDHYETAGLHFVQQDIRQPMDHLGRFDFIWMRFVLEHYRTNGAAMVANAAKILKPNGILCLADLDHNCLNHHGLSWRLESAIAGIMEALKGHKNFDPYAGRKLYAYLYDLGFREIRVAVEAHHLLYGELGDEDTFNWRKKIDIAARHAGYAFPEYTDGITGFQKDSATFFDDPRRFTYTPIIVCRGRKPDTPVDAACPESPMMSAR